MKITYFPKDEDINFFELLKDKDIHYVSVAMPGLTFASGLVDHVLSGFGPPGRDIIDQRYALMSQINHACETGTLFPRANITLMPSPSEKDQFGFAGKQFVNGQFERSKILEHLEDAFLANRDYIKAKEIYFDFRNLCVSARLYNDCLEEKLKRVSDISLRNVYGWEFDPIWELELERYRDEG